MEYVLPLLFLVITIGLLVFLAKESFNTYQNVIEQEKKSEGKFTQRNWELFKASVAQNADFRNLYRRIKVKKQEKIHHRELMKVLLGLDDEKLDQLLKLYKEEFGEGAARYARKTYRKWEKGSVRPIKQTFERFLIHLPKVMSYDLKCDVLRHLMEEYCAKDSYNLTVYMDDWEKTLEPLVKKIVDKPYTAQLPADIEKKLKWLADGEMQIVQDILRKSQIEEGKIAVSMLRQEFANIEILLENTRGKTKVTHELKFPYGTIHLKLKRR